MKSKTEIYRGKGRVIYYPQVLYPSESGIRADYEKTLHELAEAEGVNEVEKGYAQIDQKVSFTVWDTPLKRTIYFLNIDWASSQKIHQAELMLGNKHFTGMDTLKVFNSISGEVVEYTITNSGVSTLKIDNNDVIMGNLN